MKDKTYIITTEEFLDIPNNEMPIKPEFKPLYWVKKIYPDKFGVRKHLGRINKVVSGGILYGCPWFDSVAIIPKTRILTPCSKKTMRSKSGRPVGLCISLSYKVTNPYRFMEEAPEEYQGYIARCVERTLEEIMATSVDAHLLQESCEQIYNEVSSKISLITRAIGLETKLSLARSEIVLSPEQEERLAEEEAKRRLTIESYEIQARLIKEEAKTKADIQYLGELLRIYGKTFPGLFAPEITSERDLRLLVYKVLTGSPEDVKEHLDKRVAEWLSTKRVKRDTVTDLYNRIKEIYFTEDVQRLAKDHNISFLEAVALSRLKEDKHGKN